MNGYAQTHHCMFNNFEKVKAISDLTAEISLHFGKEVVFFARPKCADNFHKKAFIWFREMILNKT